MTPIHDAIPGLSDVEGYAFEALVETMARHTVAIGPRGDEWLGSGVCVSYKGQAFLATAAHLVKKRALADIGVMPKAPAPLHVMPRSLLPASIGRTSQGHRCFPQFDRIFVADDDRDIALLSFVDVPTELRDTYFFDLEQNVPSPLEGAVVVLGFPAEIMHTTRGPGMRARHLFTHVDPTRVITQDLDAIGYDQPFLVPLYGRDLKHLLTAASIRGFCTTASASS